MGKVVNIEIINKIQKDTDKDLIIADILLQSAEKDQRIKDLELIIADILGGVI